MLLTFVVLFSHFPSALGSHFRGGYTSWTVQPSGRVDFTVVTYWRVGAFSSVPTVFFYLRVDYATGMQVPFNKTGQHPDFETYTLIHTLNFPINLTNPEHTLSFDDCCRITPLLPPSSVFYVMKTQITVNGTYLASPVISNPPLFYGGIGQNLFSLISSGPGIFSFTPETESGIPSSGVTTQFISPPNGLYGSVLEWVTTPAHLGMWAWQVRVTFSGGFIVSDFIINIRNVSVTTNPPIVSFNPPIQVYTLPLGRLSFNVICSSTSPQYVSLYLPTSYPSGMTLSGNSSLVVYGTTNYVSNFTWASPAASVASSPVVLAFTCTSRKYKKNWK